MSARLPSPALPSAPGAEMPGLADWPNALHSRRVRAAGFTWHVQVAGHGPTLLLVHGTGAATHSWRDLLPLLAAHFTVVAPDLPGHGFTEAPSPSRLSLPGMARDLAALLSALDMRPAMAVGHSAGAAILCRMSLDRTLDLRGLVSLNGAMLPLDGVPGQMFAPLARLLAGLPLLPNLFAWRAQDRKVVERLIAGTGSILDARGIDLYARVIKRPSHAAAALHMMANWNLRPLVEGLPSLKVPLLLVAGAGDRTIPPRDAGRLRDIVPGATLVTLLRLGHLAHEEDAPAVASLIIQHARASGLAIA